MKKILILDFDGTIIDSNFIKRETIIKYINNKYDKNILNNVDSFSIDKYSRYQLVSIAKNNLISNKEKNTIDNLVNKNVLKSKLDPYLFNLFKFCSKNKIKIFVVSNTPDQSLKEIVKKLQINHYFDRVIGKKNLINKEKIFKQIIKDEMISPKEILSVGDHIDDYFASIKNMIDFHGIINHSLLILKGKVTFSKSLKGVIKSLY